MTRLIWEMVLAPIDVFVGSMDVFMRSLRRIQDASRRQAETYGTSNLHGDSPEDGQARLGQARNTSNECEAPIYLARTETNMHYDCDRSGMERFGKTFRTYVQYTREDYFSTLRETLDDVTRDISADQWKGEQRERFLAEMRTNGIPRPSKWGSPPHPVPGATFNSRPVTLGRNVYAPGELLIELNQEARDHWLNIIVEEIGVTREVKPDYDKEQANALSAISNKIGP